MRGSEGEKGRERRDRRNRAGGTTKCDPRWSQEFRQWLKTEPRCSLGAPPRLDRHRQAGRRRQSTAHANRNSTPAIRCQNPQIAKIFESHDSSCQHGSNPSAGEKGAETEPKTRKRERNLGAAGKHSTEAREFDLDDRDRQMISSSAGSPTSNPPTLPPGELPGPPEDQP